MSSKSPVENAVRDARCKTRRKHSIVETLHILLEGLCGEESIASLCRRMIIASRGAACLLARQYHIGPHAFFNPECYHDGNN